MNKSAPDRTLARGVFRGLITIAWIVLGSILAFMCIKVFGVSTAEIGVPALVVVSALIWYFTERRDRNKPDLIPPTINCEELEPSYGLNLVRDEARPLSQLVVLLGGRGVGGANAVLAIRNGA